MAEPQTPEQPQEMPLFPLGTVVFPGALLPLQIFELRYLQMVGECERRGLPFGVVTLTRGGEVHRPGGAPDQFETVGTRMVLERVDRSQPGLLRVLARGQDCFEVLGTRQRSDGLWLGEVRTLAPEPRVAVPEHLRALSVKVAQALEPLQNTPPEPLPWPEPWDCEDCGWLANRWAEWLPLPTTLKYRLLALRDPLLRLELIGDQLGDLLHAASGDLK